MSLPRTGYGYQSTDLRTARTEAHRAILGLASRTGAHVVARPRYPGAATTDRDIDPLAGMRASRRIELGARSAARDYIRAAREDGMSWHQIGEVLRLPPGPNLDQAGATAEAAHTCAFATHAPNVPPLYACSFIWTCQSCDRTISDREPVNGPAESERGHAAECLRLAATIAGQNAEWRIGQ
jgi:hypothetical protein